MMDIFGQKFRQELSVCEQESTSWEKLYFSFFIKKGILYKTDLSDNYIVKFQDKPNLMKSVI